jgi:hypothetical protein
MKLQNLTHSLIGILCFGLLPQTRAVIPPPDGCCSNFTTAEGTNALQSLTSGSANATQTLAFGLIAEEVAEVYPDLVGRNPEGKPESVRYEQVNAMLLNEFLKEHRKMEKLEATFLEQQKQIRTLTAGFQKVSAQLEMNGAPRMAENTY